MSHTDSPGLPRPVGRYRYKIFHVVEKLHASVSGSGDPLTEFEETEALNFLQERLREWKPAELDEPWAPYDNAVRNLMEAALYEKEMRWRCSR